MGTFLSLVGFELRFYLRRISTHVYFALFFGFGLLFGAIVGGVVPGAVAAFEGAGGIVFCNSPYVLAGSIAGVGIFMIPVVAAVMGNAIYRDFDAGIYPLVFTTPVSKTTFLSSRFLGALLVNAWIYASIPLGLYASLLLPGLDHDRVGPIRLAYYAQPYFVVLLPTLLFAGAAFFSLAAMTRKMLPNYLGGVILLIGYLLASALLPDLDDKLLAGLLDPFCDIPYGVLTEYWTAAERNTRLIPLGSIVGANRLIWFGLGIAVFVACAWRFKFAHLASERMGKHKASTEPEGAGLVPGMALRLPDVRRDYSWRARLVQLFRQAGRSFAAVALNGYFLAIVAAGLMFLLFTTMLVGKMYGTPTWPVTYQVIGTMGGTFGAFIVVVIAFSAGELVWEERDVKIQQLVDTTPSATWTSLLGKLIGLVLVVACLQVLVLVAGLLLQLARGFHAFNLPLYFKSLFGVFLVNYVLTAVLAFLVHVIVNQKYLGHLVFLLAFFGVRFLPTLGFEHNLYQYGSDTGWTYSDMNAFGPFLGPWGWYKVYWIAVALLLAVLVNLLWVRGQESAFRARASLVKGRLRGVTIVLAAAAFAAALGLGGWIFYNTDVRNEYNTRFQEDESTAVYERTYRKYFGLPQPRIVAVTVQADLFPKTGSADFKGTYRLENKTGVAIPDLHVLIPETAEVTTLEFTPPAKSTLEDKDHGYRIFQLDTPLAPGATLEFRWAITYSREGFTNNGPSMTVVDNGTFVNSSLLPSFGYDERGELSDDATRKKHGFEPKERIAKVDDPVARMNTYISHDSDWIDFDATVSTDADQIAIAPGYLEKEWNEGGRRYFHYTMDRPILNFYSFLSARYEIKKDAWTDPNDPSHVVPIEVYYHRGHEYNIDSMIKAVKKSLDYYTVQFGPYQHRQVRILEFPRYANFAQSFPNTIPFSEGIGFIARLDKKTNIDYPFYVTAHEVAHQWWAHQVIGANVQGSTMLTETMAQYSSLMVMEHEYGPDHMRRFLKYELDSYLMGRAGERKKELPLALNENQDHIYYRKGSVVMYAMKDYLGEETLNRAVRGYLDKVKYQGPPYTNSLELVDAIRAVTPPDLQELVDDMSMEITLWDLHAKEAKMEKTADGNWAVTLTYDARKYRADEKGNQTEMPLDLPIDVGVFAEGDSSSENDDVPLSMEKHRVTGNGSITITVPGDKKPVRAGIDPYNKLIDRKSDDNVVKVKEGSPPKS